MRGIIRYGRIMFYLDRNCFDLSDWKSFWRLVIMKENKLHYFAYSFQDSDRASTKTASVYIGHDSKLINIPRIEYAKQAAGVSLKSVLLSVSYLGCMTRSQMNGRD